jgi:hypothetical protein
MLNKLSRVCSGAPVALALAFGCATTSVNWVPTATVIQIGGLGWETLDQDIMESTFGGFLNDGTNTFVNIPWDGILGTIGPSVNAASDSLYAELISTPGPKIAVGLSGSTMAINDVMRRLEAQRAIDPTSVPGPDEVTFMVAGDAERGILPAMVPFFGPSIPGINYTVRKLPVTGYDITVVKGEYDGAGDWPDRPWNLLAVANAFAASGAFEGFGSVHFDAIFADYTAVPAKNITTTVNSAGGTTTTYLIPTPDLPLLRPLPGMGVPQATVDALNKLLRPLVDLGYSRNDWQPKNGPQFRSGADAARGGKATTVKATSSAPKTAPAVQASARKDTVGKAAARRAARG